MATWQFDFHLIPEAGVLRHYGASPAVIPQRAFDDENWWQGFVEEEQLCTGLTALLPPKESWSPELLQWGTEDGDRIDLLRNAGAFHDLLVRVDVRHVSIGFLVSLLALARRFGLVARMMDGRVRKASPRQLLEEIGRSDSFRFVADPIAFIRVMDEQSEAT